MKRNILRRTGALLLSLSLALSLVLPVAAAEGDSFSISVADTKVKVNETVTLTPTPSGLPADHSNSITYTWESQNTDIVTVDNSGVVKGLKEGTATIKVTAETTVETTETEEPDAGDSSGDLDPAPHAEKTVTAETTCTVTVEAAPPTVVAVTGVTLNKTSTTLTEGGTETLTATVSPSNATDKTVTWRTSNAAVATVSNGVVTAVAAGTATITAVSSADSTKTAACTVTVNAAIKAPTDVTLSTGSTLRFNQGDSPKTIKATVHPDGAIQSVTWETSDPDEKVIKIDKSYSADGMTILVTPVGPGEVTVTAVSTEDTNIKSTPCTVTVSGISLTAADGSDTLNLYINGSGDAVYRRYGAVAETQGSVNWSSSDNLIATVTGGKITGRGVGTAEITATVGNYTSPPLKVVVTENTANIIEQNVTAGDRYDFEDILSNLNQVCARMTPTGRSLNYLTNLSVSPTQGVLYYGYVSSSDTGYGVGSTEKYYYSNTTLGERSIDGLTFIPNPSYSGVATITYNGFSTNNESFSGIIRLNVAGLEDVTYSTPADTVLEFQAADFNTACRARTGRDLSYVTFDLPASNRGVLYYGSTGQSLYSDKVAAGTQYFRTRSPFLEEVFFLPAEGYIGSVRIAYHAVDTSGNAYNGYVTINVTNRNTAAGTGDVNYTADQSSRVTFKAADFNSACQAAIDERLDYVRFTLPSSREGTLYYDYTNSSKPGTAVNASTRYYRSGTTNSISKISFVPASTVSNLVTIDFTGYGVNGGRFDGTVVIQYSGVYGDGLLTYSTTTSRPAEFNAADFNELCLDITGRNLNYVIFDDLPASSRGILYSNYTSTSSVSVGNRIGTSTRLYRSGSPSLSRVAFVPATGYTGTVSIGFTAYDSNGSTFEGTVRITVEQSNDTVRYSVPTGGSVTFDANDFNTACRGATGSTLSYVRFELPASSRGTLYYQYDRSNPSKVTSSTSYYRTGSNRQLDDVTFEAAANFTGTVEFEYTAVSTNGERYTSTVVITVADPVASGISYTGTSLPISLRGSDFRSACIAVLGRELSYIQFTTLPSSSAGRLYAGYSGPSTGTQVSTGTSYYYNGTPSIDQLSFVPKAGFQGTVTLSYTGVDSGGTKISGSVTITVSAGGSTVFSDMAGSNWAWAAPSVDYLYRYSVVEGMNTTPPSFGPEQGIRRGDFVLMLCRAFQFNTGSTTSFSDVPANSYYAWAIATAKDLGIISGYNGQFMPNSPLSRQDAMLMIKQALQVAGWSVPAGSAYDLVTFVDAAQVSDYAVSGMASMVQMGIITGNTDRQLNPTSTITRAEMAVMLHRVLTL